MLYVDKVTLCFHINTKNINTVWAECTVFEHETCCCIKKLVGFKRLKH